METITIQIKELENCANLSLENAEQYIKDAELLIENSSFGHAYAFAILAYEELGKTLMCIFGMLVCWFTNKDVITPTIKGWNKTFKNHVTKQIIMRVIDELHIAVYQLFYQRCGVKESEMKRLEVKDMKELTKKFIQSPDNAIKLIESIFSSKEKFEKDLEGLLKDRSVDRVIEEFPSKRPLEKEKWRGLYVDYKEEKFISPNMIEKEEAVRYLADVKGSFERLKEFSIVILEIGRHAALIRKFVEFIKMTKRYWAKI